MENNQQNNNQNQPMNNMQQPMNNMQQPMNNMQQPMNNMGQPMNNMGQPNTSNKSTAALVLGILGIVFSFIPFIQYVGIVLAIIGLILALVKKYKVGIILNAIGIFLTVVSIIISIVFLKAVVDTLDTTIEDYNDIISVDSSSENNTDEFSFVVDNIQYDYVSIDAYYTVPEGKTLVRLDITLTNNASQTGVTASDIYFSAESASYEYNPEWLIQESLDMNSGDTLKVGTSTQLVVIFAINSGETLTSVTYSDFINSYTVNL